MLIQCARSAARTKGTYFSEKYRQVARRRGDKKAIGAVAHEILVACWYVLSKDQPYCDLGASVLRARADEDIRRRAISQLERLGHKVTLQSQEAA